MSWITLLEPGATNDVTRSAPDAKLIEPGSVSVFMMLDEYVDQGTKQRGIRESTEPRPREIHNVPFEQYCFNIVRELPRVDGFDGDRVVQINSQPLKRICRRVMDDGVNWSASPLRIEPLVFFPHYYRLRDHLEHLRGQAPQPAGTEHLELLLSFIYVEHVTRFWELEDLTARGEITCELLNCVLLPGTMLFTRCLETGEPLACRLVKIARVIGWGWEITAAYVDATRGNSEAYPPFGHANLQRRIPDFRGVVPICSLAVYPMKLHPSGLELRRQLIARGRMWQALTGVSHKHYDGVASGGPGRPVLMNSRIMIDRETYDAESGWRSPVVVKQEDSSDHSDLLTDYDGDVLPNLYESSSSGAFRDNDGFVRPDPYALLSELSDEDAFMTPAVVYGFSLEHKMWLRFSVMHVTDIKWREGLFERLVLPEAQKRLIRRLVEVQATKRAGCDDLIDGKGRGLVLDLFGPAGVGKTLSAEASSEHLHRPLYVVGANDLGTSPTMLEQALATIFKLGSTWGAVVLIDEADVYMEQRTGRELERNALVSVFLRQLENFAGILFLTTNRARAFDAAFQSRIHVSLHYRMLDETARRTLWRGFVGDVGGKLSPAEEASLGGVPLNGRQIKNAVRTASAVACASNEQVTYEHIKEVVDIMQQFEENLREE